MFGQVVPVLAADSAFLLFADVTSAATAVTSPPVKTNRKKSLLYHYITHSRADLSFRDVKFSLSIESFFFVLVKGQAYTH